MIIDLNDACGTSVLAGAMNGRATLNQLLTATANEPDGPALVFLDFKGVDIATASFLRESVLVFRDIIRGRRSHYYPVIANINEDVRDELVELLSARGNVFMTCGLDENGVVKDPAPLGELDPKQLITFDLVHEHGETDAGTLMRDYGESEGLKHTTAWNNRLTSLAGLGLIVEQSQGRAKRYRPLFEGT